jgi:GT2 family glycosyltransferase
MIETRFSVIVIGKSIDECVPAIDSVKKIANENVEIICVTGNNPSFQRNQGAAIAKGNYLLFLDNDSVANERLLYYYSDSISFYKNIDIIGGPSVFSVVKATPFKSAVQIILCSIFALGFSKSRYIPIGDIRLSSEKELILCNMCVKKSVFDAVGGFDPLLYPNEENEFLNRLGSNYNIYYHPLASVYRPVRSTMYLFIKQMFIYGQSRAVHFVKTPGFFEFIYTIPSLFFLYVISLFIVFNTFSNLFFFYVYGLPFIFYCFLSVASAVLNGSIYRKRALLISVFLFFICHMSYGVGFLTWFLKSKPKPPDLKIIKSHSILEFR